MRKREHHVNFTRIVFERRGKREDDKLELEYHRKCDGANYQGKDIQLRIVFTDKKTNSAGLQLADLTARPFGRCDLNPKHPKRAWNIIECKSDRNPTTKSADGWGLKVFPKQNERLQETPEPIADQEPPSPVVAV